MEDHDGDKHLSGPVVEQDVGVVQHHVEREALVGELLGSQMRFHVHGQLVADGTFGFRFGKKIGVPLVQVSQRFLEGFEQIDGGGLFV